ncbi:unnamed protein product [Oppiella nova]|uniref:Uncharacterized protein n=1 Tax=Oppiella nova TaxID=334625 RepID=A0A7R9MAP0_9ACAR|nr:unnamed protein product [Oppiella nova]CAG2172614.1 unnamed protein product [Oppiella nova]
MPSDNMLSALYVSIHCILWSICVAYVIYTCETGGAPVLNGILSWKGWLPISKLTYQAYLIHLPTNSLLNNRDSAILVKLSFKKVNIVKYISKKLNLIGLWPWDQMGHPLATGFQNVVMQDSEEFVENGVVGQSGGVAQFALISRNLMEYSSHNFPRHSLRESAHRSDHIGFRKRSDPIPRCQPIIAFSAQISYK